MPAEAAGAASEAWSPEELLLTGAEMGLVIAETAGATEEAAEDEVTVALLDDELL